MTNRASTTNRLIQIQAVEERRWELRLNKSEWSYLLDIEKSQYSEFCSGKRGLPFRALVKAYEYGVPVEALLQPGPRKTADDIAREIETLRR